MHGCGHSVHPGVQVYPKGTDLGEYVGLMYEGGPYVHPGVEVLQGQGFNNIRRTRPRMWSVRTP